MAPSTSEFISIFIVLAIPFLYELSSAFRYHFKFIVYCLYVTSIAIIMIPVMALRPKDCQNAIMASRFCRLVSPLLGINWKLRGKEHFGMEGPCVIVANHQSSLDVLGMFEFWHVMGKCTIVAKKELFYAWPFGLAAWLCGLTFVDRMKSDEAREVMNSSAQLIKSEKLKMWVFPEGTRKNTGELHPFKKGAFHVAVAAQVPIQPVVFSPFYFLDNKDRTFNQGQVIITALPPISTEGLQPEDVTVLTERVRGVMLQEFNRVSAEVYDSLPVTVTVSRNKISPKSPQTSILGKEQVVSPTVRRKTCLETESKICPTSKKDMSSTDKGKDSNVIKGPSSIPDKANIDFTDKQQSALTNTEHVSFTKMEQFSSADKGTACLTENYSGIDMEKSSISDKGKTLTDKGKTTCTDQGQTLSSDKNKLTSSHKEQTFGPDKDKILVADKDLPCCTNSNKDSGFSKDDS